MPDNIKKQNYEENAYVYGIFTVLLILLTAAKKKKSSNI